MNVYLETPPDCASVCCIAANGKGPSAKTSGKRPQASTVERQGARSRYKATPSPWAGDLGLNKCEISSGRCVRYG